MDINAIVAGKSRQPGFEIANVMRVRGQFLKRFEHDLAEKVVRILVRISHKLQTYAKKVVFVPEP
jgi:hypothetical protein